jgi:hypothetical protein
MIKINYLARISYLKKTLKAFPSEESLLKVLRLRSPLKRGTMPASSSNGFL